jgi:hypothetical protein
MKTKVIVFTLLFVAFGLFLGGDCGSSDTG